MPVGESGVLHNVAAYADNPLSGTWEYIPYTNRIEVSYSDVLDAQSINNIYIAQVLPTGFVCESVSYAYSAEVAGIPNLYTGGFFAQIRDTDALFMHDFVSPGGSVSGVLQTSEPYVVEDPSLWLAQIQLSLQRTWDVVTSASVIIQDISISYSRYIPDTEGGGWTNLIALVDDSEWGDPSAIVVGNDIVLHSTTDQWGNDIAPYKEVEWAVGGSLGDAPPPASYSTNGADWSSGCVVRCTVVDYTLGGHTPYNLATLEVGVGPYWWPAMKIPLNEASLGSYMDVYLPIPVGEEGSGLVFVAPGCSRVQFKIEVYSAYQPPTPDPFWTDFQRTYEILSGE